MNKQPPILQSKLDNGLHIFGEPNPENKSASMGFFVKTGARDEKNNELGISHFLEHMAFKGNDRRSAAEILYQTADIGVETNAFTSDEVTAYHAKVLPEYFGQMFEIMCDQLTPTFPQSEFDTEKKVILEEIGMYDDKPVRGFYASVMREFFCGHPCGNDTLGTQASVGAITQPQMVDYFKRRYVPSNMVLVASGNFDWQMLLNDAQRLCGPWVDLPAPRDYPAFRHQVKQMEFKRKDLNQSQLMFIVPGPCYADDSKYSLSVLASIIGDGTGSKFYWEIVDKGLAESASFEIHEQDGVGKMYAFISLEEKQIENISKIARRIMLDAMNFDQAELERAKTKLEVNIVLGGELPHGRMYAQGMDSIYLGKVEPLEEVLEKIKSVDRNSIEEALQKFSLSAPSEFRLIPE